MTMLASLRIDPEFQHLITPLSTEEFTQLEANILAEGCRDPLVIWNGVIIDGHNRYAICTKHDLPYSVVEKEFASRAEAKVWIILNQFGRRNLDLYKRGVLALKLKPLYAELARKRQGTRTDVQRGNFDQNSDQSWGRTLNHLAHTAEISHDTLYKIEYIETYAGEDIRDQVDKGEVSVHKAYTETKRRHNHENRAEIRQSDAEAEHAYDAAIAAADATERVTTVQHGELWRLGCHLLYCGDSASETFRTLCAEHTPSFTFADPPYNAGVDDWDEDFEWQTGHDEVCSLAPIVAVTPGLASFQPFLKMTTMSCAWMMAVHINNGMTRGALGFGNWICVALFGEDLYRNTKDIIEVSISSKDRTDFDYKGQKPLTMLRRLVDLFSAEGETVVDPFLGTGTTLIACEQLGRRCIGADLQPKLCEQVIKRWHALTGYTAERIA